MVTVSVYTALRRLTTLFVVVAERVVAGRTYSGEKMMCVVVMAVGECMCVTHHPAHPRYALILWYLACWYGRPPLIVANLYGFTPATTPTLTPAP